MTLTNITVSGNSIHGAGRVGGIFNNSTANPDALVFLKNSTTANSPLG